MSNYMEKYQEWMTNPYFGSDVREELRQIEKDEEQIKDRFYRDLEFGTGGLRGVMGAGTNRMNLYTVRKATQGLANFIIKEGGCEKGVAIAFDSRNQSPEFSLEAALCLNANGIRTYRFETLRPTPMLSFALRKLGCVAGIVITASHNPPEYNGYKVYWEDGAQITSPKDRDIIAEVGRVTDYAKVKTMDREAAVQHGLFHTIGEEIDSAYQEELTKLILHPEVVKEAAKDLKIVYTPLHGAGCRPVVQLLKNLGFSRTYVVPEQERPDGNFPTVSYPNPEDPKAFTLALSLAREKDADLVLATDPDADRLGVYVKDQKRGDYIPLTGNMSGVLIADYRLSQQKAMGTLPENGALVTTIVTTNLLFALANAYGVPVIEVLTGFKYIGEQIKRFEETKEYRYLFGMEESYGCLVGTHARDKDAVVAVMAICEAAAYYKKQGLTLWDQMQKLYETYGYYREGLHTITLKGADGACKIEEIMERLRKNPPLDFGVFKVLAVRDYRTGERREPSTGNTGVTGLPVSNVLYYELSDDGWCCARPSGTEPKIKFYMGVRGENLTDAEEKLEALTQSLLQQIGAKAE